MASRSVYSLPTITESTNSEQVASVFQEPCSCRQADEALSSVPGAYDKSGCTVRNWRKSANSKWSLMCLTNAISVHFFMMWLRGSLSLSQKSRLAFASRLNSR